MACVVLDICLPADRLQAVYRGDANRVLVTSREGRRISLPARHLRPIRHPFGRTGLLRTGVR